MNCSEGRSIWNGCKRVPGGRRRIMFVEDVYAVSYFRRDKGLHSGSGARGDYKWNGSTMRMSSRGRSGSGGMSQVSCRISTFL